MYMYMYMYMYIASSLGHTQLSACNVEKLGVAWGRGYMYMYVHSVN